MDTPGLPDSVARNIAESTKSNADYTDASATAAWAKDVSARKWPCEDRWVARKVQREGGASYSTNRQGRPAVGRPCQ
jgi:hypothetical protein